MTKAAFLFFLITLGHSQAFTSNGHLSSGSHEQSDATEDTTDGIKYYLKTVPGDTMVDRKMPMYNPDETAIEKLDQPPFPIKAVEPIYPEEAQRAGIEGSVWVLCLIGTDGKVQETKLLRADAEILTAPAMAAARHWIFSPGRMNGKPVQVWAAIPFRLQGTKTEE